LNWLNILLFPRLENKTIASTKTIDNHKSPTTSVSGQNLYNVRHYYVDWKRFNQTMFTWQFSPQPDDSDSILGSQSILCLNSKFTENLTITKHVNEFFFIDFWRFLQRFWHVDIENTYFLSSFSLITQKES